MVEISERVLRLSQDGGWIGVDLDGTLFTYDTWVGWNVFGKLIIPMAERIKVWTAAGVQVRIVTARVGLPIGILADGGTVFDWRSNHVCSVTGQKYSDSKMAQAIQDQLGANGLPRLFVQSHKDSKMIELWDDRAVQVVANTGRTLAEEHAAELSALQGKAQGPASSNIFDQYDAECIPGN
jgi:hypothetical protein